MPELVAPTTAVHASFLEAVDEWVAEGRGTVHDGSMLGRDMVVYGGRWRDPAAFAEYVERNLADARPETPRPVAMVPSTVLWYVTGDTFLGRLSIRHRLTPRLLDWGGIIGYDVRPSARRRGHATAMLRASLPVAHDLGHDPVLVTCDHDNVASRKVIEACGGVFEDQRAEKLRYWIPTSGT
ncbi:GNAT family N-acetyltransferase [Streptomyces litchfieldiae]|uniref:GNAT family N-acetyltransferase n=1 Tax=Streptomyces litchfieldiae TaxID=3075543 RepID=A0ABU2MN34_9ACTN|nr:GNAT family N-acetyltransferase [Streptomyces sp. DSM 44938]MDT0342748.1 GNAT family N-acetyltransferase [Streptomyces sp. DSM 44938]